MDEFVLSQESFDRLWARVQGAAVPERSMSRSEDMLRHFLDETGETLLLERRLAGICGAPMVSVCRETNRRRLRLHTAYFLLTGQRAPLPAVCCLRESVPAQLRKLCLSARDRSQAYAEAAGGAGNLRELYQDLAESEQHHARQLETLIACFLG